MPTRKNNGFTLLEMAIVMTIIALLVGGIMIGSSLIHTAQLNAITSEMESHISSIKIFQDKYKALPGDFSDAASYWSETDDGNGDGKINSAEEFTAWEQMALAGIIEGSYTGATAEGLIDRRPGINVPKSQFSGAGWGLIFFSIDITGMDDWELLYTQGDVAPKHVLWFGGKSIYGNTNHMEYVLTPQEAQLLDAKIDDGRPGFGSVLAQDHTPQSGSAPLCHVDALNYAIESTETRLCALVFKTGF